MSSVSCDFTLERCGLEFPKVETLPVRSLIEFFLVFSTVFLVSLVAEVVLDTSRLSFADLTSDVFLLG